MLKCSAGEDSVEHKVDITARNKGMPLGNPVGDEVRCVGGKGSTRFGR